MNADQLREIQSPLKRQYKDDPGTARIKLSAKGTLGADGLTCRVETGKAMVEAGLHPATGGSGMEACSGDMLLEALVACAGVTLRAVATSIGVEVRGGTVSADAVLDVRGTLAVDKAAPVGFEHIDLRFELDTDADGEQLATLLKLTERYCVIFQTLRKAPSIAVSHRANGG